MRYLTISYYISRYRKISIDIVRYIKFSNSVYMPNKVEYNCVFMLAVTESAAKKMQGSVRKYPGGVTQFKSDSQTLFTEEAQQALESAMEED